MGQIAVLCGRLFDGTGRDAMENAVLLVDGRQVVRVGDKDSSIPRSAEVIDLRDLTVLPGLIDSHEHLGLDIGDEEAQCAEPIEYMTARATRRAREILMAGITTIRNVGEKDAIGPMMKAAISDGIIPGPRIITAARPIVRTGGHGWYLGRESDGPTALRQAVRDEIRAGADLIKIMASGGVSTEGSDVMAAEFTDEEVEAIVDEAHRRGRKVAAHCHGGEGLRSAVRAGVDSIEHGLLMTTDDVEFMVQAGTYLVVTAGIFEAIEHSSEAPEFMKLKIGEARSKFHGVLSDSVASGLKIALGTDLNHGKLWRELQVLVEAGYPPMDALIAATERGGDLIGDPTLGRLVEGSLADLIAVPDNPLEDFRHLTDVRVVMKAGAVEFADSSLYASPSWPG